MRTMKYTCLTCRMGPHHTSKRKVIHNGQFTKISKLKNNTLVAFSSTIWLKTPRSKSDETLFLLNEKKLKFWGSNDYTKISTKTLTEGLYNRTRSSGFQRKNYIDETTYTRSEVDSVQKNSIELIQPVKLPLSLLAPASFLSHPAAAPTSKLKIKSSVLLGIKTTKSLFHTSSNSGLTSYSIEKKPNKDRSLIILPRAIERLRQLTQKSLYPIRLRLSVLPGGCHGFQYEFLLEEDKSNPKKNPESDNNSNNSKEGESAQSSTSFSSSFRSNPLFLPEHDVMFGSPEACVVIDKASLDIIAGAKIDYTTELIGSQFAVMDIPGSISACGCGTSFDIVT